MLSGDTVRIGEILQKVQKRQKLVHKTFALCRVLEGDEPDFANDVYSIGNKLNQSLSDFLLTKVTIK